MSLFPYIEKFSWENVREQVSAVNPEFAAFVDEIGADKDLPLYSVKYRYGDIIVSKGKFYLPLPTGELVPLEDPRVPASVRDDLDDGDGKFPAGIILNNSIELLLNPLDAFLPKNLYASGMIFGLWLHLNQGNNYHPKNFFTITSGARSIFMLPNIGDLKLHKNLCYKYNLPYLSLPKTATDHWQTFIELTRAAEIEWHVSLLFFSRQWMDMLRSYDKKWLSLRCYIQDRLTKHSDFARNKLYFDHAFSCAEANCSLRPDPYIADTAKHLIMITLGEALAFVPALDNTCGPIDFIQKVYVDDYKLKDSFPTIMHPGHFNRGNNGQAVYYSLAHPTTLEFSPKSRKLMNNLYDLKELKHVTSKVIEEIVGERLLLEATPIKEAVSKVVLDYFHYQADNFDGIRSSTEMPDEDPRLTSAPVTVHGRKFAYSGHFCRGCVRIALKK